MFEVGALSLALIHELAEPYPMTDMSRGDVLDRVYDSLERPSSGRSERVAWALQSGGEVR